jgi:ankyrin repeat protein
MTNNELLIKAAKEENFEIVRFLVKNGTDIHCNDDSALRWAAFCGHLDIVKFLFEQGADIHAEDDLALRYAKKESHTKIVDYLKLIMEEEKQNDK